MRTTTLLFALFLCLKMQAQFNYNLVIFSEDNSKFTVFLNNIQQHEMPESNVFISNLDTPMYKAKIVFEDATKPSLEKTIYFPEEPSEATYQIVQKKGKMKLEGFSMLPLPEVYVERPHQKVIVLATQPTFTETVTTRTVNSNGMNGNVNMDVNVGGTGMNVSVNVNDNVGYQETTTVVTNTHTTTVDHYVMSGYHGPIGCPWPMEEADFREAKQTLSAQSWDETRLSLAKQIISANCLFADQVRDLVKIMEWEETKLDFAKYAYDYTYDTGNYFKVSQAFEWEASTEELNKYISGY